MELAQHMQSPFMIEMLNKLNRAAKRHGHSLENIEAALEWVLQERPNVKLTPEERIQYLAMIAQFPYWKVFQVDKYHGPLGGLIKWLDELQAEPDSAREQIASYKQIEDSSPVRRELIKKGMKEVFQYTRTIANLPKEEADAYEREFYAYMKKHYPWSGEWKCVRKANQTA